MILTHPAKAHIHLSSLSLTDIQVDHVAEKVFILVSDHDRNLRVVHNLLEVKEPFMPHAGPRRARSISPTLGWTQFNSWAGKTCWRRYRLPTPVFLGFPCSSAGKESAYNAGDLGSIPGLGRSPGGRHGNPLKYLCLENPHGQRSLAGYSPCGQKEPDKTERLITAQA